MASHWLAVTMCIIKMNKERYSSLKLERRIMDAGCYAVGVGNVSVGVGKIFHILLKMEPKQSVEIILCKDGSTDIFWYWLYNHVVWLQFPTRYWLQLDFRLPITVRIWFLVAGFSMNLFLIWFLITCPKVNFVLMIFDYQSQHKFDLDLIKFYDTGFVMILFRFDLWSCFKASLILSWILMTCPAPEWTW